MVLIHQDSAKTPAIYAENSIRSMDSTILQHLKKKLDQIGGQKKIY
jgi:hypothetical protein